MPTKKERRIQTHRKNTLRERRYLVLLAGATHTTAKDRETVAEFAISAATQAHLPAWRPRIPRSLRAIAKRVYTERVDGLIAGMGLQCSREEFYRRWPLMAR
jgi:hypothetical protein